LIFWFHILDLQCLLFDGAILLLNACETEIKTDILKKRKSANDEVLEIDRRRKRLYSLKTLQQKVKKETSSDAIVCSRQFERTLRPYCFAYGFLVSFL
jgi:hypothetical protein